TRACDRGRFGQVRWVVYVHYFLRDRAWIFSALLGQDERGVALVISEPSVSRGRDCAGVRKIGSSQSRGHFLGQNFLESFHRCSGDNSPRLDEAATVYFWPRSWKMARISPAA